MRFGPIVQYNNIGNWRGSSNKCIKKQINLFRSTYCSRLYGNWRGSSNECIKKQIIVKGVDWIALVGLLVPITLLSSEIQSAPFLFLVNLQLNQNLHHRSFVNC